MWGSGDHELSLNIWCKFVMMPCKVFYRFSAHAAFHEALQGAFGAALGFSTLELFEAIGWENLDGENVNPWEI